MKITDRIKGAIKGWAGGFDWVNSDLPGNRSIAARDFHFEPQTPIAYDRIVGDIWKNSAVQGVLNWIIRAWPESYPCVKEMDPKTKKKVTVDNHPLVNILEYPNDYSDDTVLWAGTVLSFWCDGNAYWGINRNNRGEVAELVYLPHFQVIPRKIAPYGEQNATGGPDFYEWFDWQGQRHEIPPSEIVHYRFGVDPRYPLMGLSPWASVYRHVYTDNEAINYVSATLGNKGAAWVMLTPKDPNQLIEAQTVKDKFINSTAGVNRGGVVVMDGAVEATYPPNMKDNGMENFHKIPETRICALAGIPAIACGFHSGLERSTFNNTGEATEVAWNTVVAAQRMMGRQATQQLLRRPGNFDVWNRQNGGATRKLYVGFDYSEVRALQPDKQAEWDRVGQAYDRQLLTDTEARAEMGYDKFTALQRLEVKPTAAPPPGMDGGAANDAQTAKPAGGKALSFDEWAARIVQEEELHAQSASVGMN